MKIIDHGITTEIGELKTLLAEVGQRSKMFYLLDIVRKRVNSSLPAHCTIQGTKNTLLMGYKNIRVVLDTTATGISAEVFDNDELVAIAEFERN